MARALVTCSLARDVIMFRWRLPSHSGHAPNQLLLGVGTRFLGCGQRVLTSNVGLWVSMIVMRAISIRISGFPRGVSPWSRAKEA